MASIGVSYGQCNSLQYLVNRAFAHRAAKLGVLEFYPISPTPPKLAPLLAKLEQNGGQGRAVVARGAKEELYSIEVLQAPAKAYLGSAFEEVFLKLRTLNIPVFLVGGSDSARVPVPQTSKSPFLILNAPYSTNHTIRHELKHLEDLYFHPDETFAALPRLSADDEALVAKLRANGFDSLSDADWKRVGVLIDFWHTSLEARARDLSYLNAGSRQGVMELLATRTVARELPALLATNALGGAFQHAKLAIYAIRLGQEQPIKNAIKHTAIATAQGALALVTTIAGGKGLGYAFALPVAFVIYGNMGEDDKEEGDEKRTEKETLEPTTRLEPVTH